MFRCYRHCPLHVPADRPSSVLSFFMFSSTSFLVSCHRHKALSTESRHRVESWTEKEMRGKGRRGRSGCGGRELAVLATGMQHTVRKMHVSQPWQILL